MAMIDQEITERYALYNGDCMQGLPELETDSIGFSVYSPPFPELYQYSNDPRDMSNCTTYAEGMEQYKHIVREVERVTMPGRLTAVHCMDLKKGSYFQRDFPGDIARIHDELGMGFVCRITIWKDPWLIARRTRMRGLMHKMIVNDSSFCRTAGPDYVLVFRKSGKNQEPVTHKHGLKTYAGETPIPEHLIAKYRNYEGDQRKNLLSHWIWRRYASPVWMDIRSGRLMPYEDAKENEEEKHVCPLQLDVIERCLTLWSNPGDVVLTPFLGVGSEAFQAVRMGRKAIGFELKQTYFRQAKLNVARALDPITEEDSLYNRKPETVEDTPDEIEDEEGEEMEGEPDES